MIRDILKKNAFLRQAIVRFGLKRRIWMVQKFGLREIEAVTEELNRKGICSFADFGTLLGLTREGHLLKHDSDADIGIVLKDEGTVKEAGAAMESMGYRLVREFTVNDCVVEQSYMKHHLKIDFQIYTVEEKTGLMYCYLFYNPGKDPKAQYWKSVIKKCPVVEKTEAVEIDSHRIFVPEKTEEILESKYGTNWKVPDKSWVYWEGPNTYPVEENGFLKSVENGGL